MRRSIQTGANAWITVEGVMIDVTIFRKQKGKVQDPCLVPATGARKAWRR